MDTRQGPAQTRYGQLENERSAYLHRARECSRLSIPSLIPDAGEAKGDFPTPYQSLAARGVNNLASKLMLSLLPANAPFFRLIIDNAKLKEVEGAEDNDEMKAEIDRGLAKIERAVVAEIASTSDRVVLFEALKHLLVGGNALIHVAPEGSMRCFPLSRYIVKRDAQGNVLEIIVKEDISPAMLPDEVRASLERGEKGESKDEKNVTVYTHVKRGPKKWTVYQEIQGRAVPKSRGNYPPESCPWIPMRLIRVDGEDYGRSYVEEYYGDIKSLDGLMQAIIEGSAAASKVVFLVHPNSSTRERDLAESPNLGFVVGSRQDIDVLQLEKYGDFRITRETAMSIEQRLAHAFVLNSAIQRDGERVTAEEIRKMVEDLEAALGGVYSLLAVEFQLPYVACKLKQLEKQGRLPALPKDLVKPAIVTGIEALGRGNDKEKLNEFIGILTKGIGPDALQYINTEALITRICTAMGIDTDGLIVPRDEVQQQQQAVRQEDQTQQNIQALGPKAMDMFGGMMEQDPSMLQALGGMQMPDETQMQGGM